MTSDRKRIVFDTSSLVPICLHPDREPAQIFHRMLMEHELISSTQTLHELQDVLLRPKFEAWQPIHMRLKWVKLYQMAVKIIEPHPKITDCRDPKDNKFLEVALAAKAHILVSSDVHLLELHPYRGIEIIRLQEIKTRIDI